MEITLTPKKRDRTHGPGDATGPGASVQTSRRDKVSSAELRIARVKPEDWRRMRTLRLAALAESPQMFGSTLSRERTFEELEWRQRARRPVTFLASRDGRDVGLAGVHEFDGNWTVVSMWITPDARGTGVVEALIEACEDVVRHAGSETIVLGVMEDNVAGRSAYRRLGFELTGRRDRIRGDRYELWMVKSLRPPERIIQSGKGQRVEEPPSFERDHVVDSGTPSDVELVVVDDHVLEQLVEVATTDAAPDDVTPALGEGWTPDRVEWLRSYHRQRRKGLADGEEETSAIRVDGRIVGATRLHRSSHELPDQLECGIWLARSSRGRGLSDAVLRLIVVRVAELGVSRLVAHTTSINAPAIAVLHRAGAILSRRDDGTVYAQIPLDDGAV